jgi:hypothetical protein
MWSLAARAKNQALQLRQHRRLSRVATATSMPPQGGLAFASAWATGGFASAPCAGGLCFFRQPCVHTMLMLSARLPWSSCCCSARHCNCSAAVQGLARCAVLRMFIARVGVVGRVRVLRERPEEPVELSLGSLPLPLPAAPASPKQLRHTIHRGQSSCSLAIHPCVALSPSIVGRARAASPSIHGCVG